jgi:ABC-2 type transport system ATP-binding protein
MEEADQLCDRVAIIDQGKVIALDTPGRLKRSTGASTTVIVSATGDLEKLADVLAREVDGALDAKVVDHRIFVGVDEPDGVLPAVVNVAQQHAFTVTDLSVTETTLETVFINLTGKELRE